MRRAATLGVACLALLGASPSVARGFWNPGAQVVSADDVRHEQADASTRTATISGDGRYVAFWTTAQPLCRR